MLAGLRARRIPVALAMAGGYGHDLDVTVSIQTATIVAAIDSWRAWRDEPGETSVRPLEVAAEENR